MKEEHTGKNELQPNKQEVSAGADQPEMIRHADYKPSRLVRYSAAIQAFASVAMLIVTIAMVIIAGYSWNEVRMQRELNYRQFVIANAPSVRIDPPVQEFTFKDDYAYFNWLTINEGGPVYNPEYRGILLCCLLGSNPRLETAVLGKVKKSRLNRNRQYNATFHVRKKEKIQLLKAAVKDKNKRLYFYAQVKYSVPAELTLDRRSKQETIHNLFFWNVLVNKWHDIRPAEQEAVIRLIEKKGYLKK